MRNSVPALLLLLVPFQVRAQAEAALFNPWGAAVLAGAAVCYAAAPPQARSEIGRQLKAFAASLREAKLRREAEIEAEGELLFARLGCRQALRDLFEAEGIAAADEPREVAARLIELADDPLFLAHLGRIRQPVPPAEPAGVAKLSRCLRENPGILPDLVALAFSSAGMGFIDLAAIAEILADDPEVDGRRNRLAFVGMASLGVWLALTSRLQICLEGRTARLDGLRRSPLHRPLVVGGYLSLPVGAWLWADGRAARRR
jgi:hypothetical protein